MRAWAALLIAVLMVATLSGVGHRVAATGLIDHAPIIIESNDDFTAENGMARGSGTASDPYVIEGWDLEHIQVQNTDAYFTILNVRAKTIDVGGWGEVSNGRVENSIAWNGGSGDYCSLNIHGTNLAVIGNDVSGGLGGICFDGTSIRISNNVVHDNGESGGMLSESVNNRNIIISNNTVQGNYRGILLGGYYSDAVISDNTISSNFDGGLVLSAKGENVTIARNVFTGNGIIGRPPSGVAIAPDNLVNGKPLYYFRDCEDLNLDGVEVGQLIVKNCKRASVKNLDIGFTQMGIQMFSVENVTIAGNKISGNIHVDYCATVHMFKNNITLYSDGTGIYFYQGLFADCSSEIMLIENNVSDGDVILSGTANVYHNNFVHVNVWPAFAEESLFDNGYPKGGNFWSGYGGADKCNGPEQSICSGPDGIGDTTYTICEGCDTVGADRYPLMNPYIPQPQPNEDPAPGPVEGHPPGEESQPSNRDPPSPAQPSILGLPSPVFYAIATAIVVAAVLLLIGVGVTNLRRSNRPHDQAT